MSIRAGRFLLGRHANAASAAAPGALDYGAPNLFTKTESFIGGPWSTNTSVAGTPTLTAGAAADPNGNPTGATRADFPAVTFSQWSQLFQSAAVTGGLTYTFSFFIKGVSSAGTLWLNIQSAASVDASCGFSPSVWRRFSLPFTALSTTSAACVLGINTSVYAGSETPQSAQSVYIWGAQLQLGSLGPYRAVG